MSFDFPLILTALTLFSGIIVLVDVIYMAITRRPKEPKGKKPVIIDYARAFFPVLLIVLLIRSFIIQPYRVPTSSLAPTILPGDFVLVNQFAYGLRLPVWRNKIIKIGEPEVGQIVLFHYPANPKVTFIKRLIGVPGDTISYINKVLYINGKEAKQKFLGDVNFTDETGRTQREQLVQENINGIKHKIFLCVPNTPNCPKPHNFYNLVVPKGEYFMMGDNRDGSDDSRYWGFVPEHNLVGKGMLVWFSWNSQAKTFSKKIRWNQIGKGL